MSIPRRSPRPMPGQANGALAPSAESAPAGPPWRRKARGRIAPRPAFSLIEVMIGIVILGLGMVMVATMFPVAWSRARTLSEYTTQGTVVASAADSVQSLFHVSGPAFDNTNFLGDLVYNPYSDNQPLSACPGNIFPTDTWVHAINHENVQIESRRFVAEHPWRLQDPRGLLEETICTEFPETLWCQAETTFHQRLYPPMRSRQNVDADGVFDPKESDRQWDDALATRRYAYAVFHRLRQPVPYDANDLESLGATRSFDIYYVTLRRSQPTYRFALQDPRYVPNPCDLMGAPVIPSARAAAEDVMLPAPWRVQVEVPPGALASATGPLGLPTEIIVPPTRMPGSDAAKAMLVQMFPRGARFVDEVTGQVFKVVKRRVTGANLDQAFLTLDREVFREDFDLPGGDPRCGSCSPIITPDDPLDPEERLRTVWVFPPPVEATRSTGGVLAFRGKQPVVDIQVQTLNISPTQ